MSAKKQTIDTFIDYIKGGSVFNFFTNGMSQGFDFQKPLSWS